MVNTSKSLNRMSKYSLQFLPVGKYCVADAAGTEAVGESSTLRPAMKHILFTIRMRLDALLSILSVGRDQGGGVIGQRGQEKRNLLIVDGRLIYAAAKRMLEDLVGECPIQYMN